MFSARPRGLLLTTAAVLHALPPRSGAVLSLSGRARERVLAADERRSALHDPGAASAGALTQGGGGVIRRAEACKCEGERLNSTDGEWCFLQGNQDSGMCTLAEPCTVNGNMISCMPIDPGSNQYWTRAKNVLTQQPCNCDGACRLDGGAAPWCFVQSEQCALRSDCNASVGSACLGLDKSGRPWTRCENVLGKDCTVYEMRYPTLAAQFLSGAGASAEDPPDIGATGSQLYQASTTYGMRHADQLVLEDKKYMLATLCGILENHSVPYWLEGGTMLGAYRHGRYIPWDDDLDITVPIKHQSLLMGAVAEEAAKAGVSLVRSWISNTTEYYQTVTTYLSKKAPNVTETELGDTYSGTHGYFCQAWYKGVKMDLWQAFPIVLEGKALYSTGGGNTVFGRADVFPLKRCVLEGRSYFCPQKSQKYLQRMYQDLAVPTSWRQWWDPQSCEWNVDNIDETKFKASGDTSKDVAARIERGAGGELRFSIPAEAHVTPDPAPGYNGLELGYGPGITPPQ